MLKMRQAVHLDFDGHRDLLLHFLRGPSRPLRNYLNPRVGDIRIGFYWKIPEGDDARSEQKNGHTQNDKAGIQSAVDEGANHYCCTVFWNSSALAMTCCPGAIPEMISCKLPGSISPPTTSTRRNWLPFIGS